MNETKNKYKAFSLIEVLIGISIISFVSLSLVITLIYTTRVNFIGIVSSQAREEVTTILSLISRDIRNADSILSCNGNRCDFIKGNINYSWSTCNNDQSICKSRDNGILEFQSSKVTIIKLLDFTFAGSMGSGDVYGTIVFLPVETSSAFFGEFIEQFTISTRNYRI